MRRDDDTFLEYLGCFCGTKVHTLPVCVTKTTQTVEPEVCGGGGALSTLPLSSLRQIPRFVGVSCFEKGIILT